MNNGYDSNRHIDGLRSAMGLGQQPSLCKMVVCTRTYWAENNTCTHSVSDNVTAARILLSNTTL